MDQLKKVIQVMTRAEYSLDAKQVLPVIESYNVALDMLYDYDHQSMKKPGCRQQGYNIKSRITGAGKSWMR